MPLVWPALHVFITAEHGIIAAFHVSINAAIDGSYH